VVRAKIQKKRNGRKGSTTKEERHPGKRVASGIIASHERKKWETKKK
jgi:hypothetical protein